MEGGEFASGCAGERRLAGCGRGRSGRNLGEGGAEVEASKGGESAQVGAANSGVLARLTAGGEDEDWETSAGDDENEVATKETELSKAEGGEGEGR